MRNIAIIALLLVCVSLVDSAENMKEFDLMEQENMNMKDKAEIYGIVRRCPPLPDLPGSGCFLI